MQAGKERVREGEWKTQGSLMGVESIRCEGAKAGHDRGLHKLPVGTRGPVLPDSGNLGMDETVEGAVEVGTHRVAVAKPHGP